MRNEKHEVIDNVIGQIETIMVWYSKIKWNKVQDLLEWAIDNKNENEWWYLLSFEPIYTN